MGMDQEQTPHKRRVRYKGKYPRKFEEKYKELQPLIIYSQWQGYIKDK